MSCFIVAIFLLFVCLSCASLSSYKYIRDTADTYHDTTDTYHIVKKGETVWRIAQKYKVSVNQILRFNNISDVTKVSIGQKIYIPSRSYKPDLFFIWPLRGRITKTFNIKSLKQHHGIDIAVAQGTEVVAAQGGKIIFQGKQEGYGNMIVVRHDSEFSTIYAHNRVNLVEVGQRVCQGEIIAKVGSTGNSTGPHLHFEIRRGKKPLNPLLYLPN